MPDLKLLATLVAAVLLAGPAAGGPPARAAPSSQSPPDQPYCDEYGFLVSQPCPPRIRGAQSTDEIEQGQTRGAAPSGRSGGTDGRLTEEPYCDAFGFLVSQPCPPR